VSLGDARQLEGMDDCIVDAVLTSPPYLNAIDYLRGHRLSLIWLGHRLSDLRAIRSNSIGSERRPDKPREAEEFTAMKAAMGEIGTLPERFVQIINRYVQDLYQMISELARVLKEGGKATLVVGNSCLRGVFIKNAGAIEVGAALCGLTMRKCIERNLPAQSRYLPVTKSGALGKRIRTETILSFTKNAGLVAAA
jgi:DNA modification methylase